MGGPRPRQLTHVVTTMASNARRLRRARARRDAVEQTQLAPVVQLSAATEQRSAPPLGDFTPELTIYRWDRLGYSELRFGDLVSIIEEAERGDPKRWADLTRRMVKTDPDLESVMCTRYDGVCAVRWELSPPESIASADADLADIAADLCTVVLNALPNFEQSQRDLLDAIGQSYSAVEIIWGRVEVALRERRYRVWAPVELRPIHPRRFVFSDSFELVLREEWLGRSLYGERVRTRAGMGIRLPRDKYIVHQPRQILDYPTSTGLFFAVARQWWVKQMVIRYWLAGAEKTANGRWLGQYPQTAHPSAKQELKDALETLAADGIGVMADTVKVEERGGNFQGAAAVWHELVDVMDASYAKAWLGSTLNVDVGDSGSRALGESQATETIHPRRERDSRALWGDIRRYLLEPICRYNALDPLGPFGGRMPPVPVGRHVFAEEPEQVDDLLIDVGGATVNEVRISRGKPAWTGPAGEAVARRSGSPAAFSAEPVATSEVSASADAPFPWELATTLAGSMARTLTSTRSPTTASDDERLV